jgi:prephenate dehydrogenase
VDEIGDTEQAVTGADLVVLATPVGAMEAVLAEAAPHLAAGALVTDVGSVKGSLVDRLPGLLPANVHYVGAHPMAGSHLRGVENSQDDLFVGSRCVISPGPATPAEVTEAVSDFWQGLGAQVIFRQAEAHDNEVAWVSHAPHAVAFAFAHALEEAPPASGELAGSGFQDFIRIARSDPAMWAEILHSNRKALAAPLEALARSLAELAGVIEQGDMEAEEKFLTRALDRLEGMAPCASPNGGSPPV